MRTHNSQHRSTAIRAFLWLLPTAVEVALYTVLALITLAVSNIDFISEFLLIPPEFSLKTAILGSLEEFIARLIGEEMAATLITGIFWGIVGMAVYVLIWLLGNFSTEFTNDLTLSKYMHPKGVDRYSPLKRLLLRVIFHLFIGLCIIIYINLLIAVMLPMWAARYSAAIDVWPELAGVGTILWTVITQILVLHFLTVLFRLLLLRKRIFFFE